MITFITKALFLTKWECALFRKLSNDKVNKGKNQIFKEQVSQASQPVKTVLVLGKSWL